MGTRSLLVRAAFALVVAGLFAPTASAGPTVEKVDAWIKIGSSGRVGVGTVNADGSGQEITRHVDVWTTLKFSIGARHRGSGHGSVRVRGCAGAPGYAVTYRLWDGTDVTYDVVGGGYTFKSVADGQTLHVFLTVHVKAAARGTTAVCGVIWDTPDRLDTVVAKIVTRS